MYAALHMEIPHKFPNRKESEILKEVTHEKYVQTNLR